MDYCLGIPGREVEITASAGKGGQGEVGNLLLAKQWPGRWLFILISFLSPLDVK